MSRTGEDYGRDLGIVSTGRRSGSSWFRGLILTALLMSPGACQPEALTFGIQLNNDTAETVRIVYVLDGGRAIDGEGHRGRHDRPRRSKAFYVDAMSQPKNCTTGIVIARAEDGREVARFPPPICFGDRLEISEGALAS